MAGTAILSHPSPSLPPLCPLHLPTCSTIDRLYASKVVLGGSTTYYFRAQPGMPASGQGALVRASSVAKSGVDPAQVRGGLVHTARLAVGIEREPA